MAGGFELRPLTLDDAETLAPMFSAYAAGVQAVVDDDADAVRHRLAGPSVDLGTDSRGAVVGGELVGFAVLRRAEETRLWGMVEAAHRRQGVGSALMAWGVDRAHAEPGLAEVFAGTHARRLDALRLFRRFGFVTARTFNEMVHDHPAAIQPLLPPAGVVVRRARDLDDAVATSVDVYNRAFVDHWDFHRVSAANMAHLVGEPGAGPDLSFFAYLEGTPVAICLCRLAGENAFVNELGNDPAARHRGVAATLLNHAMIELARRGATRVELNVDADNRTGAIRLYESAGMRTTGAFSVLRLGLG